MYFLWDTRYIKNLAKRVSNYISSVERGSPGCKIEQHFLCPSNSIRDYAVLGIVQLENSLPDPTERLREFEGYWMIKLNTLEPHGMNSINEYERIIKKVASVQCLKIYQVPPNTISWTTRIAFRRMTIFTWGGIGGTLFCSV